MARLGHGVMEFGPLVDVSAAGAYVYKRGQGV